MSLDHCPDCERQIRDYDDNGREDDDGQRHCRVCVNDQAADQADAEREENRRWREDNAPW